MLLLVYGEQLLLAYSPEFERAVWGVNLLMRTRSTKTWPNWLQGPHGDTLYVNKRI